MILAITMNPAIDKVYAIDDYDAGKVYRPKAMTATAGGKGLNVARVARLLGEEVTATGFLGGSAGRFIHSQVEAMGIHSCFVPIEAETRTCINVIDEKNGLSTEILEPGPVIRVEEAVLFMDRFTQLVKHCQVVTASGSLPQGLPADFYRELVSVTRKKGVRFILDSSGVSLREGLLEKPDMVKPNQDEISWLLGREGTTREENIEYLRELKHQGIFLPVLSLGQEGCLAVLEDGVYHFFAPPISTLNTVGSGDSFVAGCAAAMSRGAGEIETIVLGMACGMANTQFFQTGMISKELVDTYYRQIQYNRLTRDAY